MMKFKFHEERDIINAVESNLMDFSNPRGAIWTLALYYINLKKIDDEEAFNSIISYISNNDDTFYYEQYLSDIKKCIDKAKKYKIKNIDNIVITKTEMDKIKSFNDIKKEKIVFVLVALAKYFNALYDHNKDCLFAKTSEIFKYARVVIPASERDYYLHFAYESGVLLPNFNIGSNMQLVGIISHDDNDEVVLTLNEYDYQELAYTYLNYKNGGYKRCATCGAWFKIKRGEIYCHLHKPKQEENLGYKKIKCIDCGKEIVIGINNKRTCRCDICQNDINKELNKQYQKKWYDANSKKT